MTKSKKAAADAGLTPEQKELLAGDAAARKAADAVRAMTPAERRERRERLEMKLGMAPTLPAGESDLLMLLMIVGTEFAAKYYPDATTATIHVSRYSDSPRPGPDYSVCVPFKVGVRPAE